MMGYSLFNGAWSKGVFGVDLGSEQRHLISLRELSQWHISYEPTRLCLPDLQVPTRKYEILCARDLSHVIDLHIFYDLQL